MTTTTRPKGERDQSTSNARTTSQLAHRWYTQRLPSIQCNAQCWVLLANTDVLTSKLADTMHASILSPMEAPHSSHTLAAMMVGATWHVTCRCVPTVTGTHCRRHQQQDARLALCQTSTIARHANIRCTWSSEKERCQHNCSATHTTHTRGPQHLPGSLEAIGTWALPGATCTLITTRAASKKDMSESSAIAGCSSTQHASTCAPTTRNTRHQPGLCMCQVGNTTYRKETSAAKQDGGAVAQGRRSFLSGLATAATSKRQTCRLQHGTGNKQMVCKIAECAALVLRQGSTPVTA